MAAKPYSVFDDTRGRIMRFHTFDAAEAYAKKAHARGARYLSIEHDGYPVAAVRLDWRDRIVCDLTPEGASLVPLST